MAIGLQNPAYCLLANASVDYHFFFRLYFWNKIIDLSETVVFLLRKKPSQVTFLHVAHHAIMLVLCHLHLLSIKGKLHSESAAKLKR